MGFAGYFLIVQDVVQWCKDNDIYVGPGRGSGAGSLACYCLGITSIDPIRFNLLFERFLNPDRISMPDLDLDFEKRYRDRVTEHIIEKYGSNFVAHIGTFGMQRAKAAIRSAGRTLGLPYDLGDQLSKLTLPPIHGKPQPLSVSLSQVPELHTYMNHKGSSQEQLLSWALKVEDTISNVGVHASGIIISNTPLDETVPLCLGRNGEVTTQWEMNNIEKVGLIKFDNLGLDALSKIHQCIDLIRSRHGLDIDIEEINLDDDHVYSNLRAGDTVGLFQLEASTGIRDLLVQIRPTCLEDIVAVVAIFRPGPLESDYKEVYLGVRAGTRSPEYLVPELEPILSSTSGWIIYQEQVMRIARDLCGYTLAEADDLRKAIGKKKEKLMAQHERKFKDGWIAQGLDPDKVNILWDQIVAFAAYAFNLSHATAYAKITYQMAWLKTYYPTEFMCAVLSSDNGTQDDTIRYIAECRRLDIRVLPPDINSSRESFFIDTTGAIRFGLGPIKNLGTEPVSLIVKEREEHGPFESLGEFCRRIDIGVINRLKLESLIRAGAFDTLGNTRASKLAQVDAIWEWRDKYRGYQSKMTTFQKRVGQYAEKVALDPSKAKRLKTPQPPEEPLFPILSEVSELPLDEQQQNERDLLGYYVSSHPLDGLSLLDYADSLNTVEDVKSLPEKTRVQMAIVLAGVNEISTRAKKKMAYLTLEDQTGGVEAVCFPKTFERSGSLLVPGQVRRIIGTIEITETDTGRVPKIAIQAIYPLEVPVAISTGPLEVTIPLSRHRDLLTLLSRYRGDRYQVTVIMKASDGTGFKFPSVFIGAGRAGFLREVSRLQ
jgi:DNA polymerase-3 subunit alpha